MKFIRNLTAALLLIIITDVLFASAVDTSWIHKMFIREDGDISIIPEFDDAYGVAFCDINKRFFVIYFCHDIFPAFSKTFR